jgi:hypothetical protein
VTVHELLSADHARLDALLVAATADPDRIDEAPYREFRAGLLRHIAMEEKVLFVFLRGRGVDALVRDLHADHAAIASLLVPPPSHALIGTLRQILDEHNPLEDAPGGLYERCDREAGSAVSELIERMQAIAPARASKYLDEPRIYEHIERMVAARARGPR